MKKQEIVFDKSEPKKHSIRFKTFDQEAACTDIYIRRTALDGAIPKKIRVTIEEVG